MGEEYNPHKTAISRGKSVMTAPSRLLLERVLKPRGIEPSSVLDFGTGKSNDPELWKKLTGAFAQGYDIHPHSGFEHRTQRPTRLFNLVTMNYVLNVLATEKERKEALLDAASFVAPGGLLWVSTRSKSHIDKQGRKKGGPKKKGDAWTSSSARGTVQFGMDEVDIVALAEKSNLSEFTHESVTGTARSDMGCALFKRVEST